MRKQNVPLDEMYVRLRYGSTGQDSFPCTDEVATLASDGIQNCLDSLMGPLCGMPSPIVSLGAASCSSGGALILVDGGRVDFLASDSKPSEDAVYECIPTVVESDQCLPLLRQSLGASLFQVRVQASTRYTIEPTSFPTLPPSTSAPTRFPVAATEAPTAVPTAVSTEVPTEGAIAFSPTFAPSDAPSISPSLRPTTTPPVSTAPTTLVPVTEDTSIPTATTTSSPTPVEATTLVPTGIVDAGAAGPIPSDAVSEETSNNSRSGPGGGNATTPMVIGVVIGSLVLLALLVGLERERRRKRQNEDEDGGGDDDGATTRARGSQGSTTEASSPSKAGAAAATTAAAASTGLWMAWMGKRGRRGPKDAPASSSKRALPLAAEEWDDTGSVMEDGSYRGDLRLMAMVEVGQEEEEGKKEGDYVYGKEVAGAPSTGNQNSPASTARTGALSSSSSAASGADTDKTNNDNDNDNDDDGSIETEQAIGAAAATSCPQPACFAGDACAKTTFASLFGYYRGLASSSSSSTKQTLADGSREVGNAAGPIAVEELPVEFEQDRSWNPDDNSVGSREAADPSTDLFQPCSPAAMADDQSSLVALASQNSGTGTGTGAGTGTGTWSGAAVPGVLSYRTMPVEITPDEDLIDVPLRPVTFRAADTVAL
jgi:hypothetical protein